MSETNCSCEGIKERSSFFLEIYSIMTNAKMRRHNKMVKRLKKGIKKSAKKGLCDFTFRDFSINNWAEQHNPDFEFWEYIKKYFEDSGFFVYLQGKNYKEWVDEMSPISSIYIRW